MKFISILLAVSSTTVLATKHRNASRVPTAATTFCDAFGSVTASPYMFYHNNWGASGATSGSQCTTFNAFSGSTVSWSTNWTWAGGPYQVKSYSNVAVEKVNKQLSDIKSIPSVWKYSYTGKNIICNVAYDLWLSNSANGTDKYEIMVWLAAFNGAGPLGGSGSTPLDTPTIVGKSWKVFKGSNGVKVISFVATENIKDFSADINEFFKYLVAKNIEGVSNSHWITHLQAGTEPFTGTNAVMTTSAYSLTVK